MVPKAGKAKEEPGGIKALPFKKINLKKRLLEIGFSESDAENALLSPTVQQAVRRSIAAVPVTPAPVIPATTTSVTSVKPKHGRKKQTAVSPHQRLLEVGFFESDIENAAKSPATKPVTHKKTARRSMGTPIARPNVASTAKPRRGRKKQTSAAPKKARATKTKAQ